MEARAELRSLLEEWVERARTLAGEGAELELYAQEHRGLTVKVYGGEVESLRYAHSRGLGVRVLKGGRLGYAYCTGFDWEECRRAVEEAAAIALFSAPDEHNRLPWPGGAYPEDLGIYHPEVEGTSSDEKVEIALRLEEFTISRDPRIKRVETAVYADAVSEVAVANSLGVSGSYRSTECQCYVFPIAEEGEESQTGFSFDVAVKPSDLDLERVAGEAADRATCLLGSRSMPSRRTTVVLDNMVAAEFMGMLAAALSAEAVLKARSFLAGRQGDRVASSLVTVVDDGLLPGAPSTAPFDDEGVPTRRKELISEGVLVGYLHNMYTASRSGTESTGNATRSSFRERPGVGATNLFLLTGKGTREELVRGVEDGVLILQVVGAHAGANPVSGEISLGALGLRIRNGELEQPLREITLAGKATDFLRHTVAVGEDLRFLPFEGSLGAPTVVVEGVMVSGRG